MATETERRFKVDIDAIPWEEATHRRIEQYYLTTTDRGASRVRLFPDSRQAFFTAKGPRTNGSCEEAEVAIPYMVAEDLSQLAISKVVKTRYEIVWNGLTIEVDVFRSPKLEFAIAEIELFSIDQIIALPYWIDPRNEITGDETLANSSLAEPVVQQRLGFVDRIRAMWSRIAFSVWSVVS